MSRVMVFAPAQQLTVTTEKRHNLAEAVRIGVAAGALDVTRYGLGSGHADAVHEPARRVELKPLETV